MYLKTENAQKYKSALKNVLAIERKGEAERFKPWLEVGNRRLLWHGTRVENLMPILYNGLRVAPSDAWRTGSTLGKGIYFSDVFDRSIAYSDSAESSIFVILAEVALGRIQKYSPCTGLKNDNQYHSLKRSGRNVHDKSQRIYMANGCMVPAGDIVPCSKLASSSVGSNLFCSINSSDYNEFVVFDPSQVKIRYLLELDSKIAPPRRWC